MHLFVLFLVVHSVYGTSRISNPNMEAVNFARAIKGLRLSGSVIKEIEVDSEISCQVECVEEVKCFSYNFGPRMDNTEKFKCQLSNSDRFSGFVNLAEDKNFKYRGLQSPCESNSSVCNDKEVCIPHYQDGTVRCKCKDGYKGKPCEPIKSCAQLFDEGITFSGVYTINPDDGKPIQVFCDLITDGGGWTVLQRRVDGYVDFYLGWESYKIGFGMLNGEFWLGNDNLHRLTTSNDFMLRVDLEDFEGNIRYAEYTTFQVSDEGDKYRLLIGGYSGTAGDSMMVAQSANGMQFSTNDNDNDLTSNNCAQLYKGAWWYRSCHQANLNGLYLNGSHSSYADGVNWYSFRGYHYSLKRTEMKIKPNSGK